MTESTLEPDMRQPEAPPRRGQQERIGYHRILLILSTATLLAAAILTVPDSEHVAMAGVSLPPMCGFRSAFGLDCPGCGLTRCFVSAAHGRLAEAWKFHPGGLLLFALMVAQIPFRGWQIWRLSRGRDELRHRALMWIPWLLLAVLVVQWLWRMSRVLA